MEASSETPSSSHPEVKASEIELGRKLGEGAFSKVYAGRCRGQEVAVKIITAPSDPEVVQSVRDEIKVMTQICNPNVVLFMGASTAGDELMIVTEMLPHDLHHVIITHHKEYDLSLNKRMRMAREVASGMAWLHQSEPMFIHRDLKLHNVLVTHDLHCKVCDFGLTIIKDKHKDKLEGGQGTPNYMAPEVFLGEYDEKCDVYSFGLVLWEMVCQQTVFQKYSKSFPALVHAVLEKNERPKLPSACPTSLVKLITSAWHRDPAKRPSFQAILERMDDVVIDVAIYDHAGRRCWKSKFKREHVVTWDKFVPVLCKHLKVPPPLLGDDDMDTRLQCVFRLVAAQQGSGLGKYTKEFMVTSEDFGKLLLSFGPFDNDFLDRVEESVRAPWFFGALSSDAAEELLMDRKPNTFLVRFSSTPGAFTLSVAGKAKSPTGRITHHRILHVPGKGFFAFEERFNSLSEVVKRSAKKLRAKHVCPGHPFATIWAKSKRVGLYAIDGDTEGAADDAMAEARAGMYNIHG